MFFSPDVNTVRRFGESVDTDGSKFIVGAPNSNTAFIYNNLATTPAFEQKLTSVATGSKFGKDVTIEGTEVFVGAPFPNEVTEEGQVLRFTFTGGVWAATGAQPVSSSTDVRADFGASVALRSSVVVIGAPGNNSLTGFAVFANLLS